MDCLHDYRTAITIHGDDVLAHNNWEISELWLSKYKCVLAFVLWHMADVDRRDRFLVDPATLNVVNRWRRERGEPELNEADYIKDPPPVAATA